MMRHRNSSELLSVWDEARGAGKMPSKSDMGPRKLAAILPHTFILEATDDRISFRLAGTALAATHGEELTGRFFGSVWAEEWRRQAEVLARGVAEDGIGILICSDARNDQAELRFETLVLPLKPHGDSAMMIGVMSPMEKHWSIGAHPVGLHDFVTMRTLVQGRTSDGALREVPLDGGTDVSFIDFSRRGRVPQGVAGRKVQHLLVIEGGA